MSSIHRCFDLLLNNRHHHGHTYKKPDSSHTMWLKFLLQLHKVWFLKLLVMVPHLLTFDKKWSSPLLTSNKKQNSQVDYISSHTMLARCIYCIVASTYQVPQASSKVPPYNTILVRFLPLVIYHNPQVINHNLGKKCWAKLGQIL